MATDAWKAYIQRFARVTADARKHGELYEADVTHRVFVFGPVTLDTIQWVSEREDLKAVSRVEREGREWLTVLVQ